MVGDIPDVFSDKIDTSRGVHITNILHMYVTSVSYSVCFKRKEVATPASPNFSNHGWIQPNKVNVVNDLSQWSRAEIAKVG